MSEKKEILAPVGSKEMLYAAVRTGADAVYLGSDNFNARRNAENFSDEELKKAVDYCHISGVRVYLTLNISIYDNEFVNALNLAKKAYEMGVDALIVSDLGVASVIKKNLPDFSLHGSTQLSIMHPSALSVLKQLGFKRIVAAREMSKSELGSFCKEAQKYDIEVETFVHGALCMCVSGQCLMSAFLGGRSGNRGLCAGPCRLPFKVKGGTGYDLSLKDLSLCKYLNELSEAGVLSFKIEGRMKRPEYVAAAVTVCKSYLDCTPDTKTQKQLEDVFSRSGFTDGYYIGKTDKEMFGIRTKEDVKSTASVLPELHSLYRNERQSIGITGKAEIKTGQPSSFSVSDGKNSITVIGDIVKEAQKSALNKTDIAVSLSKTGGTPYYFEKLDVITDGKAFLPGSQLNRLRRDALNELSEKRKTVRTAKEIKLFNPESKKHSFKGFILRLPSADKLPEDLSGIFAVSLPIESDIENLDLKGAHLIADIPRLFIGENYVLNRLKYFKSKGAKYAFCGNLSHLPLIKKAGLNVIAGFGLNIYNSYSAEVFKDTGAKIIMLSPECTVNAINCFKSVLPLSFIAYGKIPLMIFRNCPNKNGDGCEKCNKNAEITDRLGVKFVIGCRLGFSELFNSVPIYLSDRLDEFNCEYPLLYFTDESKEEIKQIIDSYKLRKSAVKNYTRGLYYKGVD